MAPALLICPICRQAEISEITQSCPRCRSDLEYFQLINKIKRNFKDLSTYSRILSVALMLVISGWAWTLLNPVERMEDDIEVFNEDLANQNKSLNEEIVQLNNEIDRLSSELEVQVVEVEKDVKPESNDAMTVVVKEGQSLWSISEEHLGNGKYYFEIAADNDIRDPNKLNEGQIIHIHKSNKY